jgi:hypothetical protein
MDARLKLHPSIPVHANQLSIAEKQAVRRRLYQYHCAAGHCSNKVLRQMLQRSKTDSIRRLAKHVNLLPICTACLIGKSRKKPHKKAADSRSTKYLNRIHVDLSGRQRVASIGGNYYYMVIIDDATRKAWTFPLKRVTDAAATLRRWLRTEVRQLNPGNTGPKVQTCRCDSGPEFASAEFEAVLAENNISWEPSPSDSSQARGVVERAIGAITQIARVGMTWAKAPKTWWAEAVLWATTTRNMTPTTANHNSVAPHTAATGKPVDTSKMRPFGCIALPNIPTIKMGGKLNDGARTGVMFGYALTADGGINGWRVYNVATNRVTPNFDCTFNTDVPAMQHILASVLKSPLHYLLGKRITKAFNGNEHHGTVMDCDTDDDSKRVIYGITYDDGEQEDLFVEELLRHIDEDQPLDAARVEHLHRNVKPDGDQKWVFVPPGADEAPAESQMDDLGSTSTTPATVTDHSAAAPPTRTLTRDMDMSESRTGSTTMRTTRRTTKFMAPASRENLGVIHPAVPATAMPDTAANIPAPCTTTAATMDETESENGKSNNTVEQPQMGLRPNSMKERCLAPRTTRTASPKPL